MVQVLGLILSDVIGDPLDVIASGPTVPQTPDPATALQILDKYGLATAKYSSVREYLHSARLNAVTYRRPRIVSTWS